MNELKTRKQQRKFQVEKDYQSCLVVNVKPAISVIHTPHRIRADDINGMDKSWKITFSLEIQFSTVSTFLTFSNLFWFWGVSFSDRL